MALKLVTQTDFRGRNDNGDLGTATWITGSPNQDFSVVLDTVFRLRIACEESNNKNAGLNFDFYYSTGGAYALITGSTPIQFASSAETSWTLTNDDDTTVQRISSGGTWVNGEYTEDAQCNLASSLFNTITEFEGCFVLDSGQLNPSNTVTVQIYYNGGSALEAYTNTPTITALGGEVTVIVDTLALAGVAETASVDAPITISADTLALASVAETTTIQLTTAVPMDTLALTGVAETTTIVPGAVSVPMDILTLAGVAETASVQATVSILMDALALAGVAESITIDAPITVSASTLTLIGVAEIIIPIGGPIAVIVNTISLTGVAETVAPVGGPISISVNTISLVGSAEFLNVGTGLAVLLDTLVLAGSAEIITPIGGPISIIVDAVVLAGTAEPLSVAIATTVIVNTLSFSGSAETLSIVAIVSILMDALTLVGTAETITIAPGAVSISANSSVLASTAETITVVPGATAVLLNTVVLVGVAETVGVSAVTGLLVFVNTLSLVGVAETTVVMAHILVQINTLALTSIAPTSIIVPGAAIVGMQTISLNSLLIAIAVQFIIDGSGERNSVTLDDRIFNARKEKPLREWDPEENKQVILLTRSVDLLAYHEKVLATENADLLAYWPMWESSGLVADNYQGVAARDAFYSSVDLGYPGIGDGNTVPLFDGTDGYVVAPTAFMVPQVGTITGWFKPLNAGVWTDGERRTLFRRNQNMNHWMHFVKGVADNTLTFEYRASGWTASVTKSAFSLTGWTAWAVTYSDGSNDGEINMYINGEVIGAPDTIGGWWVDAPANFVMGAMGPSMWPWLGYIAHIAQWKTVLSSEDISELATI